MNTISRRTALATGAAAITTGVVTAPLAIEAAGAKTASAVQTDPVAVLVRKSEAYEKWLETIAGTVPEEEFNALCEVGSNMQREICDKPATSIEAIRGKVQIAWEGSAIKTETIRNGPDETFYPLDPMRFVWSALKDLERLAGEARP